MAIQSRFAVLLTLCLFATSGLAVPVPVPGPGAPAVNPDVNEIVGQNTITALGTPTKLPRAGLQAASLPFLVNPDTLPLTPAHGVGSKRDPRFTDDLHASSPMKAVQVESDHQGQKPPVSSRAAAIPQHVDGAKLSRRHDDTTTSFNTPLNVVKGTSHGYSGKRDDSPKKSDETTQATTPGNVSVQDHKHQERESGDSNGGAAVSKVDAAQLATRKNDETAEFAAPLKVVDVKDHKYADSPSQALPFGPSSASSSSPSRLPLPDLHSGKMQARKHDQKTEIDTLLGGEADYHPYSDDRKREADQADVKVGQVQARKHDEDMHLETLLGGAFDYHPYSDNKKRTSKDQTVHESTPMGGLADYHRYNERRRSESMMAPSPTDVSFQSDSFTNAARSPRATEVHTPELMQ